MHYLAHDILATNWFWSLKLPSFWSWFFYKVLKSCKFTYNIKISALFCLFWFTRNNFQNQINTNSKFWKMVVSDLVFRMYWARFMFQIKSYLNTIRFQLRLHIWGTYAPFSFMSRNGVFLYLDKQLCWLCFPDGNRQSSELLQIWGQ